MSNKPSPKSTEMREKGKFLIIEQGEYSDYSMYFIRLPEKLNMSESDIAFLIGLDEYDNPTITGHIWGEIDVRVEELEERAKKEINQLFSCFDNRKYTTVLDRLYSKEELLDIATTNDGSGLSYWEREIDNKYTKYVKVFKLYSKITNL